MENKEKVMKALAACSEFCCGECPYQHLDDKHYKLRCIHALIKDAYEVMKITLEKEFYDKYCSLCGSQRCEGIGTEWFEGCKYKEQLIKGE